MNFELTSSRAVFANVPFCKVPHNHRCNKNTNIILIYLFTYKNFIKWFINKNYNMPSYQWYIEMTFKTLTISLNKTSYPPINLGKVIKRSLLRTFYRCAIDYWLVFLRSLFHWWNSHLRVYTINIDDEATYMNSHVGYRQIEVWNPSKRSKGRIVFKKVITSLTMR